MTVTHPEMTRYFMTIPEAASLVVQAGAIGGEGEIFVLDMGEPVRILDLARNMIRLSGKEPDRDVAIEFVGARPGEKLHEELWGADEEVRPTAHPKIQRVKRRGRRSGPARAASSTTLERAGRGRRDARGRLAAAGARVARGGVRASRRPRRSRNHTSDTVSRASARVNRAGVRPARSLGWAAWTERRFSRG